MPNSAGDLTTKPTKHRARGVLNCWRPVCITDPTIRVEIVNNRAFPSCAYSERTGDRREFGFLFRLFGAVELIRAWAADAWRDISQSMRRNIAGIDALDSSRLRKTPVCYPRRKLF